MNSDEVEARLAEIATYAANGGGATLCEIDVPWLIKQVRSQMQRAERAEGSRDEWWRVACDTATQLQAAEAEVTALREALMDWETRRDMWVHREPFKFPDDSREMGLTSEEFIERKLAWMAIGDAWQRAEGRLSMLARAALAGKQGEQNG